jgi:hypothetical protein
MADYPDEHHHLVDVVGVEPDGTPYVGTMMEADFAPTRRVGTAHAECARCGYVGPIADFIKRKGAMLCTTYGCANEGPNGDKDIIG